MTTSQGRTRLIDPKESSENRLIHKRYRVTLNLRRDEPIQAPLSDPSSAAWKQGTTTNAWGAALELANLSAFPIPGAKSKAKTPLARALGEPAFVHGVLPFRSRTHA